MSTEGNLKERREQDKRDMENGKRRVIRKEDKKKTASCTTFIKI